MSHDAHSKRADDITGGERAVIDGGGERPAAEGGGGANAGTRTGDIILKVDALRYAYKNQWALQGISFAVTQKSIHGFVGPNGAGKTTALKILATLMKPRQGKVSAFGMDIVKDYKAIRRLIGFMPDHFSMYRQMTVFEYLDFFAAAHGLSLAERDRVIKDVLALTDMDGRKDSTIKGLSRGMQQRVSLARVLVHDPALMLLDEPASGLDPRARIELMEILKELQHLGKTIFISSHILADLASLCDSITIIDRGKIKYTGAMKELLTQTAGLACFILTLATEHPPTEEILCKLDGMHEVSRHNDDSSSYQLTFDRERLGTNTVLKTVLDAGGEVVSFREEAHRLDQAFMRLTEPGVPV